MYNKKEHENNQKESQKKWNNEIKNIQKIYKKMKVAQSYLKLNQKEIRKIVTFSKQKLKKVRKII